MKTSLHTIKTQKDVVLHGLIYDPDTTTKKVVAHVHGMGGNFYENFFLQPIANKLTAQGVAFSPFNNSGNGFVVELIQERTGGLSFIDGGDYKERFEDCIDDIRAHIDYLESQGYEEVHLSGYSLGAPKVVYYLTQTKDPRVKSLILLSPSDMLGLVRGEGSDIDWWLKTAKEKVDGGNGEEFMSKRVWDEYPITANTFLNIFGDDAKTAIFNFLNPSDGFEALGQISVPVCAVMGTKDDALTVSIEDTMRMIKEHTQASGHCETHVIEGAPHSYYKHEDELASVVTAWATNQ